MTDLALIPAERLARLEGMGQMVVRSREDDGIATDNLAYAKNLRLALQDAVKKMLAPHKAQLDKAKQEVEAKFGPWIAKCEAKEAELKSAISTFRLAEQARIEAERRQQAKEQQELEAAIREQAEADGMVIDPVTAIKMANEEYDQILAPPKTTRGEVASSTLAMRWTYEIVDPDAVPRDLCEPAAGKIRAKVNGGMRECDGLKIFQVADVRSR